MRLLADLKVGNADSGFVGDCHGFSDPDRFETDIWRSIVDRADLTGTRLHDLRHFFASQLIANGLRLVNAGRLLGLTPAKPLGTRSRTASGTSQIGDKNEAAGAADASRARQLDRIAKRERLLRI